MILITIKSWIRGWDLHGRILLRRVWSRRFRDVRLF
jgi:hypothetical protein